MAPQSQVSQAPPLVIQFVPGRMKDGATQSKVRSHAMTAFRSWQRHQKQLESEQKRKLPVVNTTERFCRCLPLRQLSTASSGETPKRVKLSNPLAGGSDCCDRCGGVQFLELSPLQQLDILQRLYPAITTFAAADFDPFGTIAELPHHLTSNYSQEINAIKAHAITFCSPGPIKSIVFPEAMRTPALLTSMLYMTYAYLSSVRGWSNQELGLGLKTAAIAHINYKLSHPSTAMCTNTIASIAYLSTGTWAFGDAFEEVEAHMTGMELLVKRRGMKSLGVYPFGQTIRKYLVMHHILVAAISVQPASPTFDFDFESSSEKFPRSAANQESPLYCPLGTFDQVHRSKRCSEETTQILYIAKDLTDLLVNDYETGMEYDTYHVELFPIKSQLESFLSATDPQSTSHGDWIFECCRLTALIVLEAIETSTPLKSSDPALTLSLVRALEKTDIGGNWGDMLGVLYWVSMIGSASSQGSPGYRLLDSTLGRTMFEMAFTGSDFECAVRPTQRFASMQMALKRRGEAAFIANFD